MCFVLHQHLDEEEEEEEERSQPRVCVYLSVCDSQDVSGRHIPAARARLPPHTPHPPTRQTQRGRGSAEKAAALGLRREGEGLCAGGGVGDTHLLRD